MNDIQPFLAKKICRLLTAVSSQNNETFQFQLFIGVLHRFYLVESVLIRCTHQFERLSRGAKDCPAFRQNP